jgi:hypothetical protein
MESVLCITCYRGAFLLRSSMTLSHEFVNGRSTSKMDVERLHISAGTARDTFPRFARSALFAIADDLATLSGRLGRKRRAQGFALRPAAAHVRVFSQRSNVPCGRRSEDDGVRSHTAPSSVRRMLAVQGPGRLLYGASKLEKSDTVHHARERHDGQYRRTDQTNRGKPRASAGAFGTAAAARTAAGSHVNLYEMLGRRRDAFGTEATSLPRLAPKSAMRP